MMQHYWSLEDIKINQSWISIGTFDGVHLGHQEIIRRLTTGAHKINLPAVVVTFFPHPAVVLGKVENRFYISTPDERADYLGSLGVDIVITHPFSIEISKISAHDFIKNIHQSLNFDKLIIGYDFALGKNREGNAERLRELGNEYNYDLLTIQPVKINGEIVSSSLVRLLLRDGEILRVNQLLGRLFQINGQVISGDGRGHLLGIPTANLDILPERALPKEGVYVCKALVNDQIYSAIVNIGIRPTFEYNPIAPRVEAHLLDFDEDLYGKLIRLEFIERLREEFRFPTKEALIEQIQKDILQARKILSHLEKSRLFSNK